MQKGFGSASACAVICSFGCSSGTGLALPQSAGSRKAWRWRLLVPQFTRLWESGRVGLLARFVLRSPVLPAASVSLLHNRQGPSDRRGGSS